MVLDVSFEKLYAAARHMGASTTDTNFKLDLDMDAVDPIDIKLKEGLEISLQDVSFENGLLSHQGRQILLYIQDQGKRIMAVLEDGAVGKKYHVSDCDTLAEMRNKGRFERYRVTNDISADFFVSGEDEDTGNEIEGDAQLKVCKNCLRKLNYRGYEIASYDATKRIFSAFKLEEFFSTYSSSFPHIPTRFAGPTATDNYTNDWTSISSDYRNSQYFVCEGCNLALSEQPRLLHTHHKNGVKTDNHPSNLMALCIDCHSKQPCHGHMFVSRNDRQMIARLRRKQGGLDPSTWGRVIQLADPGVEGLALKCKQSNLSIPKVWHEIRGSDHDVAMLELAWIGCKVGITIDSASTNRAKLERWKIWKAMDALDRFDEFADNVR